MSNIWNQVNQIDFDAMSRNLVAAIENGDPRFLAVILAILVFVGSKMVSGQPGLRSLGLRAAAAMFLCYGGYLYFYARGEGDTNGWLALKAANAAGGILALTWIVFPILNFIISHVRLALAAFLGYGAYAIITRPNFTTDDLPMIALEALIPVGLTLVVAWIVHPIWDYVKGLLPEPARQKLEENRSKRFKKALNKARRDRGGKRRRPAVIEPSDETVEEEAEIEALELERVSRLHTDIQRRRDKTRLQVELFYLSATPDIGARLNRDMFQDLIHRYLGDHVPVEDVEENARQLQLLLQQHQQIARQTPAIPSLEEMTRRVLQEQQRALGLERREEYGYQERREYEQPRPPGNGAAHPHGNGAVGHEDDVSSSVE